jgi:hypothetical protein
MLVYFKEQEKQQQQQQPSEEEVMSGGTSARCSDVCDAQNHVSSKVGLHRLQL